ncbi:MAG: nucleotide exchange factor GrpE [Bacteroidales bacterium]|nr:nucleotide exchange factor GrpE [Candidatus Cryptobacteroides aphodequi]
MANEKKEEKMQQAASQAQEKKETKAPKAPKVDENSKKIAELTDKLSKEHDDYLRLMAEFETFRRRSAEEKMNLVSTAAASTIKGLLPVLDDCERALKLLENSADEAAREGTQLIYTKLMSYLKTCGLEVIEAQGAKFDTDFHEAVTQFPAPTEEQKGCVIDVVQTGYLLAGKVLRYAKVVVGA